MDLQDRTTEILQELIRLNTVNPPGNEAIAQDYLRGLLEPAGFECELLEAEPGRPNQIARLPGGSDGPTLVLLGHVDTVLANPAEWQVDPWSGELRDGCVWGRGAVDMKSQVAAEAAAAIALAEQGWRPGSGELKLVFTADEEAGAEAGAKWLCEQHPDKVRADLVVNEGAGEVFEFAGKRYYGVCVGEKGVFRFTLATSGVAGHASIPRIGDNALVKMAPVLEALADARPTPIDSLETRALMEALGIEGLGDLEGADPRLSVLIEPLTGVTLAPTKISASEKINVIPSRAELQVDCRVPPGLGEDAARERVHELLGEDGYTIEFDETVIGNSSPVDAPLMETIREFVEREDPGAELAPVVLPGFSDSRWFREAFPDCVAYGFFPQNAMGLFEVMPLVHGADERIPVEDLGLAARFYSDLIERTLG